MNRHAQEEARDSKPAPSPHPDVETLAAYRAEELSPSESERLDAHLNECAECRRILRDLAGEIDDPELDAAWKAMQHRLAGDGEESQERADAPFLSRPPLAWAAVLLLFVSGGLISYLTGMWPPRHSDPEPRVVQPLPSPPSTPPQNRPRDPGEPLYPRSFSRAPGEVATLPLFEQENYVPMMLFLPPRQAAEQYRLCISDSASHPVWKGTGRRDPTKVNLLSFQIPRDLLAPGTYSLRLFPAEADSRAPVEDYVFLLEEHVAD